MTNEQAYVVLENCASLLDSGTRFFTEDHVKQFHEAYELAMMALRKTERKTGKWMLSEMYQSTHIAMQCDKCNAVYDMTVAGGEFNFCPHCGADMRQGDEHE